MPGWPDWRKAEDYAYADRLRLHQWAWEFLRRSKSYQAAWKRYWEPYESGGFGELEDFTGASQPFNLEEPADPSVSAAEAYPPWSLYSGMKLLDDPIPEDEPHDPDIPFSEVPLTFDLTIPLAPQIAQATEILDSLQRTWLEWVREEEPGAQIGPQRRPQIEKFKSYIRAMDGEAAGASQYEIGRVLFAEAGDPRDAARYALKAGADLAERGYRDLLLMGNR